MYLLGLCADTCNTQALLSVPGAEVHLHLKGHTQTQCVFAPPQKVNFLTCYILVYVGYFDIKLHIHTLGTLKTYFTSCEKGIVPCH